MFLDPLGAGVPPDDVPGTAEDQFGEDNGGVERSMVN
jgi:hypothetical protein